jgi:hypothetical protein
MLLKNPILTSPLTLKIKVQGVCLGIVCYIVVKEYNFNLPLYNNKQQGGG